MFSIVTTQKILERLYTENSVWGKIVAQTKCFYVKLDSDWWEEEENALLELANSQADIKNANDLFVDIEKHPELKIIASSPEAGVFICMTDRGKQVFVTGHSEYDADTLEREYLRDKEAGLATAVPANYYPQDDPSRPPLVRWRSCANLLYSNWLNYFVYQTTPYNINEIK